MVVSAKAHLALDVDVSVSWSPDYFEIGSEWYRKPVGRSFADWLGYLKERNCRQVKYWSRSLSPNTVADGLRPFEFFGITTTDEEAQRLWVYREERQGEAASVLTGFKASGDQSATSSLAEARHAFYEIADNALAFDAAPVFKDGIPLGVAALASPEPSDKSETESLIREHLPRTYYSLEARQLFAAAIYWLSYGPQDWPDSETQERVSKMCSLVRGAALSAIQASIESFTAQAQP